MALEVSLPELDGEISYEEVKQAIRGLKGNRAPGDDGIPTEVYKVLPDNVITLLRKIYNHVYTSGDYPQTWSRGLVCPIYKVGSRTDSSNYRGISLLNGIGKIFTAILNNRLSEWVEGNDLLPEEQFGFRKNRQAIDCIYILNTVIEKARADYSPLYICYIDLKKAFDKVCHYLLWMKLRSLGISGKFLRILISMHRQEYNCHHSKQRNLSPAKKG